MKIRFRQIIVLACYLFLFMTSAQASAMMTLPDDTSLYYEDTGKGSPIIFIPGWTGTHEFFNQQVAYFQSSYRVITMDPRGQGLSPSTLNHNDYLQHGKDLAFLINQLELNHVTLIAWSWGCYDAYAYVRQFGVENIQAFVCIDAAPKAYGKKGEWRASVNPSDVGGIIQQMENHRYDFTAALVQSMVENPISPEKQSILVHEFLHTSTYVALLLMFDALHSDYTEEAKQLDVLGVPTLNVISTPMANDAKKWLSHYTPHAQIEVLGKHMMFWEYADTFNPMLAKFLDNALAKKNSKS